MVDAISQVKQYDYDGNFIRDIKLPGLGNAGGFGKKEETIDFYSFTNYKTPSSIYKFNIETGISELYWKPEIDLTTLITKVNKYFLNLKMAQKFL